LFEAALGFDINLNQWIGLVVERAPARLTVRMRYHARVSDITANLLAIHRRWRQLCSLTVSVVSTRRR